MNAQTNFLYPDMEKTGTISRFPLVVAQCALRAMIHETATVGKPGLVCPDSQGAHHDMDISTFVTSAVSLQPYFIEATRLGMRMSDAPPQNIFMPLRNLGRNAEDNMFACTNGINTHKGQIFSLGLLCAASGSLYRGPITPEVVCSFAGEMAKGVAARDFSSLRRPDDGHTRTAGERFFLQTGHFGIRGEAESGFHHALEGLYLFQRRIGQTSFNESALEALLLLMAKIEDTNIWKRGGLKALRDIQRLARRALNAKSGMHLSSSALCDLQNYCLRHRVSPGGSADLLSVVFFLHFLPNAA